MKSLGHLVKILKGRKAPEVFDEPRPGAERYLQIDDLRPGATPKYARDDKGVLATEDDVLIAWDGANAGTAGFGLRGYAGSTIAILRPDPREVRAPFLGYFLHSKFKYLRENCTGATIPHISRRSLEELQLTIPPLPEQKRIAATLAKADRLRRLRRHARDLSDTYLQSVFLDMFGDPVSNPRGWDIHRLGKHLTFVTSGSRGWAQYYSSSGARFIRSLDVQMNRISNSDAVFVIPPAGAEAERTRVQPGDVLLTITGSRIGRVAYVPSSIGEAYISQHVAILRLDSSLRPDFVYVSFSPARWPDPDCQIAVWTD